MHDFNQILIPPGGYSIFFLPNEKMLEIFFSIRSFFDFYNQSFIFYGCHILFCTFLTGDTDGDLDELLDLDLDFDLRLGDLELIEVRIGDRDLEQIVFL